MKRDEPPIIVNEVYECSSAYLWKSLTDPEEMTKWFFGSIPDFRPVVGFHTEFKISTPNRDFIHLWDVTKVIEEKHIAYRWKYKDYKGDSEVHFEILSKSPKSELKFTHKVFEDFQAEIPEFSRESGQAGWDYFLKVSLKKYHEKNYNKTAE